MNFWDPRVIMKFYLLPVILISVALLILPYHSLAQNQPLSKKHHYPEIGFELISKDANYEVLEYKPPDLDRQRLPFRIRVASLVHFSNEKIIYWESQSSSQYPSDGLSVPVQIKFQLTCKSSYITKWKINSDEAEDQTDGTLGQDEASYMSYTVNPLPRDNEDPLAYNTADSETSEENDSPPLEYNVTELTINWFGPKFKSGFVDCVHGLNDKRKSRLHIFQRITDPQINPFVRQRQEFLEENVDTVVPCTVHDPDKKPKLEWNSNIRWETYKSVQVNKVKYSYNWKIGFTWKNRDPNFLPGTHYKCHFGNQYSLTYRIESKGSETTVTQKRKSKLENAKVSSQVLKTEVTRISEGPNNYLKFACSLNTSSNANSAALTSITVTPCIFPDYCSSSESEGSDSASSLSVKDCTEKEVHKCEIKLTSKIANKQIHGRITCGLIINRKPHITRVLYFAGLSKEIYLLSSSYKPAPVEEIFKMSINRINSTTVRILCESLRFLTFPSIKVSITYDNKTTQLLRNERVTTTRKFYFREIFKSLNYENDIDQVSCYAPPYDSPTWLHVSLYWPENYVLPTTLQHANGSDNNSSSSVGFGIRDEISTGTGVSKGNGISTRLTTKCRTDNDSLINSTTFSPPRTWNENSYENDHTQELGLIYCHNQVALYSHINFNYTAIRQFNVLAEAWQYALRTYGPLGRTPHLHVVLHTGTAEDKCTTSNMDSYVDRVYGNRTVIDCGKRGGEWTSPKDIQILVSQIGKLIFRIGKQTGNWPGSQVCQSEMGGILTYDIYMGIGRKLEASQWRRLKATETVDYPRGNTHWFRDWFYPIYTEYGNSTVLNRFLSLLHEHWPRQVNGYDYVNKLRLEEFVHFWSGAAGVNLRSLANKTFGWDEKNERKFMHAADEYSKIMYKDKMTRASGKNAAVAIQRNLNEPPPPVTIGMPVAFTIIIAVVFVCILVIGILIFVVIYRRKIQSLEDQIRELTNEEIQTFFEGNANVDKTASGYVFVESQPFNKDFEIPRDRLDVSHDKVLGSGQFGLVLFGKLKNDSQIETADPAPDSIVVAVKTVKPNVEVTDFMDMLLELKVMCYVGEHENIASVLGAVTANIKNREVYIALEFCAKGDLLRFLKEHRPHFKHLFCTKTRNTEWLASIIDTTTDPTTTETTSFINDPANGTSEDEDISFSTLELLDWAHQISSGMEFISSRNVIHGDLAARNILLTENYIAKISDFGLSRQLHNYSTYMKKSKTPLPWKWMAIESLRDMQFSIQSDVWAFGVTLFEIFTLGTLPYPGQNWTLEFVDELVGGLRLKAPHFGNDEIFTLMMNCMKRMPKERIKFPQISQKLVDIKNELQLQLEALEADNNIGT